MLSKVLRVHRESGMVEVAKRAAARAYGVCIRDFLPISRPTELSGVLTGHDKKWGDEWLPSFILPHEAIDQEDYESALVQGLRENIRAGDRIVIVGGGSGVTSVVAALTTGPTGRVHCFEGSADMLPLVEKAATRNGVSNWLSVTQAVVGDRVQIYGDGPTSSQIAAEDLPECDILELDCEGSEISILKNITFRPRVILVETHGFLGSPTPQVRAQLESMNYSVQDLGVAEISQPKFCGENDVMVLCGVAR